MAYGARLLSGLRVTPSRGFKSRHLRQLLQDVEGPADPVHPVRRGLRTSVAGQPLGLDDGLSDGLSEGLPDGDGSSVGPVGVSGT